MPETRQVSAQDLDLDLANFRTVRQATEQAALEATVATSPDRFWALTTSLLDDGYLPTESIIVLRTGRGDRDLTVKEGNRRVGAVKVILGHLSADALDMPADIAERIEKLGKDWKSANATVPCTIYKSADAATVDRIVRLAHGKGEKAGRDPWNALARARHNRDRNAVSEPALDLLEKYLKHGKNIAARDAAAWAGDYPLSVLDEAIRKLAPRLGAASGQELAAAYPTIKYRDALERVLHDIGFQRLGFKQLRGDVDFAASYGIPLAKTGKKGADKAGAKKQRTSPKKPKATGSGDPKTVRELLKSLQPRGNGRVKVVDLRDEALRLNIGYTPLAFCFVLRSMFEISAKAYCDDHAKDGLSTKDAKGDKSLAQILGRITKHLTSNQSDKEMVKVLHGANAELARPTGLLSVTSMNQLVHNPRFSVSARDVASLFVNVFPLLEAMNA